MKLDQPINCYLSASQITWIPTYLKIDSWVTPGLDFLSSSRKSNKKLKKKKKVFQLMGWPTARGVEAWEGKLRAEFITHSSSTLKSKGKLYKINCL